MKIDSLLSHKLNNLIGIEKLDNGIQVLYEQIPAVATVSAGIWIKTGSRNEKAGEFGYFHLCEHMAFKAIPGGGPKTVAFKIDQLGGHINASTSREDVCFFVNVTRDLAARGLRMLADLVFSPIFSEKELYREKKVIVEELKMYHDSPEDAIFDLFLETVYHGSGLAHTELGTEQSINASRVSSLLKFYRKYFHAGNIIITMVGPFSATSGLDLIKKIISNYDILCNPIQKQKNQKCTFKKKIKHFDRDLEQIQFIIAFPGFALGNAGNWKLELMNILVGGNQSSVLFQNLREKQGLCYSIYSYRNSYADTGFWAIHGSTSFLNFEKALTSVINELIKLLKKFPSKKFLLAAKNYLKLNFLMSLESTEVRMSRLAKNFMTHKRVVSSEEILEKIRLVSAEEIIDVYQKIADVNKMSIVTLGKNGNSVNKFLKEIQT